jgi:hypothetical protein
MSFKPGLVDMYQLQALRSLRLSVEANSNITSYAKLLDEHGCMITAGR